MEKPKIYSLGFEGSHRAGKGTQIELLSRNLQDKNIPFLVVRGDGSRLNEGKSLGDPVSQWWKNFLPELTREDTKLEDWNQSSYRLARELIVFRDRILPKICQETDSNVAVLLVDRSIISRTMIPRELNPELSEYDLYPKNLVGNNITVEKVCPDIIFNLIADVGVLLSRLDPLDPKYIIRKRNIENKAIWYNDAIRFIPESVRDRVIEIDSSMSPEYIQRFIQSILIEKIPELGVLLK